MSESASAGFMLGLNGLMILYTLWVLSLSPGSRRLRTAVGLGMLAWLALLHVLISNRVLFPADISGPGFLAGVFLFVGLVGLMLFGVPALRRALLGLDQGRLLLLQGVRVFYGAGFLMQAALGNLPATFGILDGWTHMAAGFFGLVAAFCISRGNQGVRRAWFANLFGLADILVVASTLSLVLLPDITPHHSMMYAVFLPAPLWLWFHFVSLGKLLQARRLRAHQVPA